MSEKRYEYGDGDKGSLIYDNYGTDDYYFLNNPKEMDKFVKLLNDEEEYWQEKYDVLLNKYKEQLELNIEQDREIRLLKEDISLILKYVTVQQEMYPLSKNQYDAKKRLRKCVMMESEKYE